MELLYRGLKAVDTLLIDLILTWSSIFGGAVYLAFSMR